MDDSEAISRCRSGDPEALRVIVERYQKEALGHALAILRDVEDSRDAVQDAFLDAFQSLDRFDTDQRFYPWLYTILRHRCFKVLVGRRNQNITDCDTSLLEAPNQAPEISMALERALWSLSPSDREVITLRHLDGLTYQEISERLDIRPGTVMSRLFHARRRLRSELTGRTEKNEYAQL